MDEEKSEKFIPIPQNPMDFKPITSDTELSKDLLKVSGKTAVDKIIVKKFDGETGKFIGYDIEETKNVFYEIINEDMTKANLGPDELRIVREHCLLSNYTQAISKDLEVSLSSTQKFLADNLLVFLNSSRAKSGWNAMLSKTDKTITQQSIEEFTKQLQFEQKKPRWKFW